MGYRYAIIGAGRTGRAAAYDLFTHGEADEIRLFDLDPAALEGAMAHLSRLGAGEVVRGAQLDARDVAAVTAALGGVDAVLSASAYWLNLGLAQAAVAAGAHFNDLGGNTSIVQQELALHPRAVAAGVSVVPDCGLAPGLVNTLAAAGIEAMETPREVRQRVGGLTQDPRGPLGYELVFSITGLTNEYQGVGVVLRDGQIGEVPCLEELESIRFEGFPPLEAFVTSGGTSTAPYSFEGRVDRFDYKTIRYQGHRDRIKLLQDLGLLSLDPVEVGGAAVVPRRLLEAVVEPRIRFDDVRDLVLLRVSCAGTLLGGGEGEIRFEMVDRWDSATGFSAMERSTAFPAAAVTHMQASGLVAPGARPLEVAVPPRPLLVRLAARGLPLVESLVG
ncbi:MAG: saccharopine dehydrogenase NADP-binding domain-containing protein [Deltaproteobacteria bacterium]|nr:saccharopine dehydrogenase NADP-binding domain-containing protein [Deltaproteobacteria bacterium]